MTGLVWFDSSCWVATIDDWWYATGSTEAEAVRKVTERYEQETERMTHGQDTAQV